MLREAHRLGLSRSFPQTLSKRHQGPLLAAPHIWCREQRLRMHLKSANRPARQVHMASYLHQTSKLIVDGNAGAAKEQLTDHLLTFPSTLADLSEICSRSSSSILVQLSAAHLSSKFKLPQTVATRHDQPFLTSATQDLENQTPFAFIFHFKRRCVLS